MIGFGLAIGASAHKLIYPSLILISNETQQCANCIYAYYHLVLVPLFPLANLIILKGQPSKFPVALLLASLSHAVHYCGW